MARRRRTTKQRSHPIPQTSHRAANLPRRRAINGVLGTTPGSAAVRRVHRSWLSARSPQQERLCCQTRNRRPLDADTSGPIARRPARPPVVLACRRRPRRWGDRAREALHLRPPRMGCSPAGAGERHIELATGRSGYWSKRLEVERERAALRRSRRELLGPVRRRRSPKARLSFRRSTHTRRLATTQAQQFNWMQNRVHRRVSAARFGPALFRCHVGRPRTRPWHR